MKNSHASAEYYGMQRWLGITRAAGYADMSTKTLRKYILSGEIYGARKGGKWYVDRDSIDAFFLQDKVNVEEILARIRR